MARQFNKIAIVGLISNDRVSEPVHRIAEHLAKRNIEVLAIDEIARSLAVDPVQADDLASEADLIVAVGGDGTMLHAARLAGHSGVPLLGINRGRLGFLADISPAEMLEGLDSILEGQYSTDSRLRLTGTLTLADGSSTVASALNDVVLQRRDTGRMLDFETRIDGRFVNAHRGDGLVVATPTGSTAYALSCGGPIIEPQLDVVALVPICPHTLSDRPIVTRAADQVIEIALLEREDTNAEVIVDGHAIGEMNPDDRLRIVAADTRITLIHPPGYDYFDILRSKLHWGRDHRREADKGGR